MATWLDIGIWITILSLVLTFIGLVIWIVSKRKDEWSRKDYDSLGCIIMAIGIIVFLIVGCATLLCADVVYAHALRLPYDYESACKTVEETANLLMKYDNISAKDLNSLGYGLEANELKLALKDAITTKNQLHADIVTFLNNPLAPYKDVLRVRLPVNFV
jgi:hypothetical protein